jgi:hypothetical protein
MFAFEIVELVDNAPGKQYAKTVAVVGPFETAAEAKRGLQNVVSRWPGSRLAGKSFRLVDDASISSTPSPTMSPAHVDRFRPSPIASRMCRFA